MRLRHSLTAQDEASEKIATAFIEGSSGAASRVDSPAPGADVADRVSIIPCFATVE